MHRCTRCAVHGGPCSLALAAQSVGNTGCEATENLTISVDDVPAVLNIGGLGGECLLWHCRLGAGWYRTARNRSMRHMDQDAATHTTTLPDRLSRRLESFDEHVNRVHDDLNLRLPRLWWPLEVPQQQQRLGTAEHALYVLHATVGATVALGFYRVR